MHSYIHPFKSFDLTTKISDILFRWYAPPLLVAAFMAFGFSASAQVVVIENDSLWFYSAMCPTPVSGSTYITGYASNFNSASDSINIKVFWGDGTSDTAMTPLYENGTNDLFGAGFNHTYVLSGTYHIVVIATAPNNYSDTASPQSSVYITTNCVTMSGYVYYDLNSNCTLDVSDDTLTWKSVYVQNGSGSVIGHGWTDTNGFYQISLPTGLSNLQIASAGTFDGFTTTCPSSGSYTFNSYTNQSFNFGKECLANVLDKATFHGQSGVGAPGDTAFLTVMQFVASCTNSLAHDTVVLDLDPNVVYIGPKAGPTPNVVTSAALTWYVSDSTAGQWLNASVWIQTLSTATLYDTAFFTVSNSTANDVDTNNNLDAWHLLIGGPYDPNNKLVFPQGLTEQGFVDTTVRKLVYQINFQNTGTDTAKNIYVIDTISDKLDIATLNILGTSHKMNLLHLQDGILRFDFQKIYLPDSNTNEPLSHGYVMYEIAMQDGVLPGDVITNTAHIYFDYNAPIVTNTTMTTIMEIEPDSLTVHLVAGSVTCYDNDNGHIDLTIISGNPPYTFAWSNGAITEDVTLLSAGTYTVTVTDSESQQAVASALVESDPMYAAPKPGPILGTLEVTAFEVYYYDIIPSLGSSYLWGISGGEMLGWVNNSIEVLWHGGPTGKLWVEERDQHGCLGYDTLTVPIMFVGIAERASHSFSVFPNPASHEIIINVSDFTGTDKLLMHDMQSRIIGQWSLNAKQQVVSIEGIASGLYFLSIGSDSSERVRMMIR